MGGVSRDASGGAVGKIHTVLAVKYKLEDRIRDLSAARSEFLARINDWAPGLKKLLGLIRWRDWARNAIKESK